MEANGTNPCPFPSNSSNVADERTTVPDPSNLRPIVISEVSQETHQHLHETSAVVDAAYNRIRQIRRRLAQLTEALPTTLGLRELEQRSDRTISPPLFFQHTPIDRQGVAFSDLNPHSVGSWQMSPIQNAPWNGIQTMRVSQTNLAGDDGSTLLGRRVAARLATSPVVEDIASVTDQLIQDAGQVYARAHDSVAAMTRGYESGFEQFLPTEGEWMPAIPFLSTGGVSTSAHTPSQSMSQLSPHQSSQRTAFQPSRSSLGSSLDPEWDLSSTHNLVSSERLSLLSNFSVQDLLRPSTPSTSNPPGRPLISDEPLSNALSETVDPISESRHHLIADSDPAFQGRNYVVHRRYNHNGEELVHNITIDWDEDDSWLMPSPNSSRRYRNRFSNPRPDFDISRTETLESQPTPDSVAPVTQSGPSPPASASNSSVSPNTGETPPRRRGWGKF